MGKDNYQEHANEIREAYENLLSVVIPQFGQVVDEISSNSKNMNEALENIFYEAHRVGINLRHLGRVRNFALTTRLFFFFLCFFF